MECKEFYSRGTIYNHKKKCKKRKLNNLNDDKNYEKVDDEKINESIGENKGEENHEQFYEGNLFEKDNMSKQNYDEFEKFTDNNKENYKQNHENDFLLNYYGIKFEFQKKIFEFLVENYPK